MGERRLKPSGSYTGSKGEGYFIFNCAGVFIKEVESITQAAEFIGQKPKSVQNAVYQETSIRGWVIIKKRLTPKSVIAIMELCRERDRRWIVADSTKTEAKYFEFKQDAKAFAEENKWTGYHLFRSRYVEKHLPEELYLKTEDIMPLQVCE
jgi:hypothetical protein